MAVQSASNGTPVVLEPKEGRALRVVGETIVVKVGAPPGGGVAVIEETTPPGGGPPPHQHDVDEEMLFVLDGRYEVRIGDSTRIVEKGGFAVLPPGIPHAFRNVDESPSRALVVITPAHVLAFFESVGALAPSECTPDALVALGAEHGVRFLPPSP